MLYSMHHLVFNEWLFSFIILRFSQFVSWYYKDGETLKCHHLPSFSLVVTMLLNHSVIISLSLVNHFREKHCRIYSALGWLNIIIKKNMREFTKLSKYEIKLPLMMLV